MIAMVEVRFLLPGDILLGYLPKAGDPTSHVDLVVANERVSANYHRITYVYVGPDDRVTRIRDGVYSGARHFEVLR